MLIPTLVNLRWDSVPGATGWEILVDGVRVATAGARARTTKVGVKTGTKTVSVIDLPGRTSEQTVELIGQVVA